MSKRSGMPVAAILLGALVAMLGGCIGIETTYEFSADGSGTVALSYRVSQFVTKLATAEKEEGKVPLPITKADFEAAVKDVPGVSLVGGVKQAENEEDISVEATLHFDKVESLAKVDGFGDMPSTLTPDGDRRVFRQTISSGSKSGEQTDADTMQIIEALFSGYEITFVVKTPAEIKSTNLGEITGRTVRYSITVPELLSRTEAFELEVVW